MKFILIAFAVGCTLVSCKYVGKTDHLPPKEMQQIILDINLAEAAANLVKDSLHKVSGARNVDSLSVYYDDIFAHYHITKEQFSASFNWYKNHPDELDTLYNNLGPVIAKMQIKK